VNREDRLAQVLAEFAHTLAADFSIEETLDHLVARIVTAVPVTGAGVILRGSHQASYIVAASDKGVHEIEALQSELQEGPCVTAYLTGEPVLLPDLRSAERFPRYSPRAREKGVAAVFAFPLCLDGRRLGALDLYRDTVGDLDPGAMEAAKVLADVAAAYLFNARVRGQARENERELRHRSLHDALTGLPNRTLLEERLEHAARRAMGSGLTLAVLFVDLDGFKAVNDKFGHHVGDQLLNSVGSRLTDSLRPGDTLARLAGDEFVIVCEDLSDPAQAEQVAERVTAALSKPFSISGQTVVVSASVGVAYSGGGNDIPKDMLRDADLAMYEAKRSGGAQHRVLHRTAGRGHKTVDEFFHDADAGSDFGRSLKEALERNELRLAYQPIVETRDGSLSGVEALLRWQHPRRGWVEPEVVVAVAERTGMILDVGRWALTQACRDLEAWRRHYGAAVVPHVAINVSPRQLMAGGFVDTVTAALSATGTDPTSLHLEVTESVFLEDAAKARTVLNELRRLGVKLALDDFGTGYSSLAYLEEFPFDIIKIDQTFTAGLVEKRGTRAIVAAVIELAHALELDVIAEGVENEAQLAELSELGSDRAQGHLFSPALLPEEFSRQILGSATEIPIRLPLARV
jgi:diguanylate cyclase (GGDEF)-like protein